MKLAVISLSESGVTIGEKIKKERKTVDIYPPPFTSLSSLIKDIFYKYDGLIFIMATGIVVRVIAGLIKDKRTDPAVIVIDEKGKYVISLLSGHLGGANQLAAEIAGAMAGAIPVITTSSDIHNKPSLDCIFDELGWVVENPRTLAALSYALINEEDVYIFDNTNILKKYLADEKNITFVTTREDSVQQCRQGSERKYIYVSNKKHEGCFTWRNTLIVRPKNIILGIGCKRGIHPSEMEEKILAFLDIFNISIHSIKNLATIVIKRDEEGINRFSEKYNIQVRYFSIDEINNCDMPSPSEKVNSLIGAEGVCEPAVMLCGTKNLFITKTKMANLTLAAGEVSCMS